MKKLSTILVSFALVGCTADNSDLQGYIQQVKQRPPGRVEPLPEFVPAEIFVYSAGGERSPFEPPTTASQRVQQAQDATGTVTPPENHIKQPLEYKSLGTLTMIGHLDKDSVRWALLKDDNGSVYRVKVGDFVGMNYGRIIEITPTKIELLEIVPNGPRAWIERPRSISLSGLEQMGGK